MSQYKHPQKGSYLVKNPWLYLYLRTVDVICCVLKFFNKKPSTASAPKKILLINWAHKGDVIIATSMLPLLKKHYAHASIGMLVGSWSKDVIEGHPLIEKIHTFDHPKINRSKITRIKKICNAIGQFFHIVQEIRQQHYDLAVDLYFYYPTSHLLTWCCKIPRRIGYRSGGGAPLLTDSLAWSDKLQHMSLYHLDLLKLLGITSGESQFLKSSLPPVAEGLFGALKARFQITEPYIIFHPYSGNPSKDWDEQTWSKLIDSFKDNPYIILFTGGSIEEREKINKIIHCKKRCINLAHQTSFFELQLIVKHATALICVDTMIIHLAAAYHISSEVLWSTESDPILWSPASWCRNRCFYLKQKLVIGALVFIIMHILTNVLSCSLEKKIL